MRLRERESLHWTTWRTFTPCRVRTGGRSRLKTLVVQFNRRIRVKEMGYKFKHEQSLPDQRSQASGRPHCDPTGLNRLFDEWMQGDETEQRETFETLRQSLDQDRRAGYKLFPQA
jgi:hypothetical protein